MTVGDSTISTVLFGWDGDATLLRNDDLTDVDFVYANETYELSTILLSSHTDGVGITFPDTNSGSISDAAVRSVMTLHVDGTAFALGDATYLHSPTTDLHSLTWDNSGLTWSAGDTVQLEMWVTE